MLCSCVTTAARSNPAAPCTTEGSIAQFGLEISALDAEASTAASRPLPDIALLTVLPGGERVVERQESSKATAPRRRMTTSYQQRVYVGKLPAAAALHDHGLSFATLILL